MSLPIKRPYILPLAATRPPTMKNKLVPRTVILRPNLSAGALPSTLQPIQAPTIVSAVASWASSRKQQIYHNCFKDKNLTTTTNLLRD